MNREEALSKGIEIEETKHSMKRRTPWHDYNRKGTYMLTLVVDGRMPVFGKLKGNPEAQTQEEQPHVELSPLGKAIRDEEIKKISHYYRQIKVWKLCIMPDHLHIILRVDEDLAQGKHLGQVIRGFKTGCSRAWWKLSPSGEETLPSGNIMPDGNSQGTVAATIPEVATVPEVATIPKVATVPEVATVPKASPLGIPPSGRRKVLFEPGYNDKILMRDGQLENWKRYLDDNPRRLLMKRRYPQLFTVVAGMDICGEKCQVVGNRFLLDIPNKMAVIVHRRYSEEENAHWKEKWLACGEQGGVLVSAAISPKEKEVLREAMNRGYRIILLRENGFPEIYKPSGESFDACARGFLLQIAPWEYHMERKAISRAQCLYLNALAEKICK